MTFNAKPKIDVLGRVEAQRKLAVLLQEFAVNVTCPACGGGDVKVEPGVWVTGAGHHRWVNHRAAYLHCNTCNQSSTLTIPQQLELAKLIAANIAMSDLYSVVMEAESILEKYGAPGVEQKI
jgi:transcription elongation factor Elf1